MDVFRKEIYRPWEELPPDALALIFKKISFQEILTVVPIVCKSWRKVAMQPDCWQEIDIEDWCRSCNPENMERMVKILVSWSGDSMRKLSVCGLKNDSIFAFIAGCASNLQTLRIPSSEVTDSIAIQLAPKLATLTYLDISYCKNITSSSLEALGKHCKFLTRLSKNRTPCGPLAIQVSPNDDEAFAIAKYMCRLKHLELAFSTLTNAGMEAIFRTCKELEHLDIRGCRNVEMQDSLAEQCQRLKVCITLSLDLHLAYVAEHFFPDLLGVTDEPLLSNTLRSIGSIEYDDEYDGDIFYDL